MTKRLMLVLAACLLMVPGLDAAEDAKAVLDGVGKAMGEVSTRYNIPAAAPSSRLARASLPASHGRASA
jgi:hypothetical protein